ncbi:spore coat protein [Lujinxingia litoralis]|uniref:Spore coat protein n=1 Tax=Lujinxingia litoralis TaxID=2211119 RepID=A0A328C373_9DELT|nr:glycosyltransferase family protein [Lujinxingia litoralis]RAL20713.1 spore coat protein [Lujinxingia litoralis]
MKERAKVVAVVQARMSSERLPGKVLMPLAGRPALWHIIERLKRVRALDEVIVATSDRSEDDPIASLIEWLGDPKVSLFRGSRDDVLSRFYLAVVDRDPEFVVRITGDTPLVCVEHLERMLEHLRSGGVDGVDGHHGRTGLTLGFGSEVYRTGALIDAHLLAMRPEEREHVSLFIKERPEVYRVEYLEPDPALCSGFRLTMDYPEDYALLREIYAALYRPGDIVDCQRVLEWLHRRPDLVERNAHCLQRSAR